MIDRLMLSPIVAVGKIRDSNMASPDNTSRTTKIVTKTRKRKRTKRSARSMIYRRVELAIPMIFEGATNKQIYDETHRLTGLALDGSIVQRLRAGQYKSYNNCWTLDHVNKTYTGPLAAKHPSKFLAGPSVDKSSSQESATDAKSIIQKCLADLAARGLTDVRIDPNGKVHAIQSTPVVLDL